MAELKPIRRASEVIDLLWRLDGGTPSDIAVRLDVPVSTTYDHLQSLEATGYVVRERGTYRLGYEFLAMGSRLQRRSKLFHVAGPAVRALAEETGEIANVSVEEDGRWVLLHNESGRRSLDLD